MSCRSRSFGEPPLRWLAAAAALSLWTGTSPWRNGTSYRRAYVDGVPTGPLETIGRDDHPDGYRVVFELDREWLPA